MAESEPFLARWSRLKRKPQAEEPRVRADEVREEHASEHGSAPAPDGRPDKEQEAFDLAALPKIEEITGKTDLKMFMDARVPSELRSAALRRAWTLDPAIRDFIEIAENQYDWTAPDG